MNATEWTSSGVTLPARVEEAFWSDSLVFFCGAGVSSAKPSELPGFRGLTESVARTLGHAELVPQDNQAPVQFDLVMGKLDEISGDIHQRVSSRLQVATTPNAYHRDLWRIATAQGKSPRIVTTNFDVLFEAAAKLQGLQAAIHVAPALPLGDDFTGLVHLHGVQNPPATTRMVLTDRDFGRAYITEGWATQFLTRLFARYTVVLIGYSAEDTIIQYLNRALPNDGARFAFTKEAEDYEVWTRLGIIPVPFPSTPADPYGALEAFIGDWSARLFTTASQRFDRVTAFVASGPAAAESAPNETRWMLSNTELARHFRQSASASDWAGTLDEMGLLDSLFDPETDANADVSEWSKWLGTLIDDQNVTELLAILARHEGRMHSLLWLEIWQHLYDDYSGSHHHRQLVLILAVDQPSQDAEHLSMFLPRVASNDPLMAEQLLLCLLSPQLRVTIRNDMGSHKNSLETQFRVRWRNDSVREAWPVLMPRLSNRVHLLSAAIDLIRTVEGTDAFFMGREHEDAISLRRYEVERAGQYFGTDPYIVVVDIARDLLREHVQDHGTSDVVGLLEDHSEMVRRLAMDALAEARSTEAESLMNVIMALALPLQTRSRPEAFRLLAVVYKNASVPIRLTFLDYLGIEKHGGPEAELTDDAKYNVLVWLGQHVGPEDPVHRLREQLERAFVPEEFPSLKSPTTDTPSSDEEDDAAGRIRFLAVSEVVRTLREDDARPYSDKEFSTLGKLRIYLKEASEAHVSLLDELIEQRCWTASIWCVVLESAVEGITWTAIELLERLEANVENKTEIATRLASFITYPRETLAHQWKNEQERTRLLLGLWDLTPQETSGSNPADPSKAMYTTRGSLADTYVEALIRAAERQGKGGRIPQEGTEGLQRLLDAQEVNPSDPSPMMLARFSSAIQNRAPQWFEAHLLPRLTELVGGTPSTMLWAGLLAQHYPGTGSSLRRALREQIRTGWPFVASSLPAFTEAFMKVHAMCFSFDLGKYDYEWPDAFLTHAPDPARDRWIRLVAFYLDQEGKPSEYQPLLFAHWAHRLDGQPPISQTEQRAFVHWLTLPGIDVTQASELFVRGPELNLRDEDLYDDYEPKEFPREEHPVEYLRVANHLMRNRSGPPYFAELLIEAATVVRAHDQQLARQTLETLLSLGYSPARTYLEAMR